MLNTNIIWNMEIILAVISKTRADYITNGIDIKSLALYLYERGITADTLDGALELQAFTKTPNDEYKAEDYPADQWDIVENADDVLTYDYKLLYCLEM